jgi:hypothetical protein
MAASFPVVAGAKVLRGLPGVNEQFPNSAGRLGRTRTKVFASSGTVVARGRYLLAGAVVCLLTAAWVTRFGNQPINAIVMTWNPQSPPAEWAQLRDTWWRWHTVRASAGIVGLGLTLLAVLGARRR